MLSKPPENSESRTLKSMKDFASRQIHRTLACTDRPRRKISLKGGDTETLDLEDLLGCKVDVLTEGGISPYLRSRFLREATPLCRSVASPPYEMSSSTNISE